ncbi:MAG: bifunctional riboflavin kinase/FAD synthetase [Alphaproteobacteria bacterium]|nr:bifunctional riboflavin kinase/FAD synthetase [Alphaproteobacteria bacterium]
MKIVHTASFWPESAHDSVMVLGNFDGMHKGHQAVIGRARDIARAQNLPLAMMTFEPHPRRFFQPELPMLRIVPFAEKARLLRDAGVEYLYVARFNAQFSKLSAEEFIGAILRETLHVAHVVTGHDFAFGNKRSGDGDTLNSYAKTYNYEYTQVPAVTMDGANAYSSTAIRQALAEGRMKDAAAILGRLYSIKGIIIHGDKRGRSIGFPTANIRPAPLYRPRYGVYAVRLHLGEKDYDAVANFGFRPTLDGQRCVLEVHAIDAEFDAYGHSARVEFLEFIRAEKKFSGVEALVAQISNDVEAAKAIHATHTPIVEVL